MNPILPRRRLLASGAAAAALGALPVSPATAAAAMPLTVTRRSLDVNGKAASVFTILQGGGSQGLVLDPGQRFAVALRNRCGEPTIIHWHGQTPPVRQDGVTQTRLETLIPTGGEQGYSFVPRTGTHWMHSHHGLQEQMLMAAPLVVRTAEDARADTQEVIVLLHDFTFRDPREILAGLTGGAGARSMPGMSGMAMPTGTSSGQAAAPDLNDVDYDAYLANDRTLADPQVVRVERGGRVRLRLINGATSTAFWISLGALQGQVVAVDGDPVRPVPAGDFPMAQAQRVDVLLLVPSGGGAFPVLAQREGDRQRTGIILATPGAAIGKVAGTAAKPVGAVDLSLERRIAALVPLPPRRPDRVLRVRLTGSMMPYAWGIDGKQWPDHVPLAVAQGERVALDLVNHTAMAHPMHLHGHHFQVQALEGRKLRGALRDTVLVPPRQTVRIAFDADKPGRWLFHCHNLYHMATGMMTEVAYIGFHAGY
jgi:FtsP/CotA-like multicopper oxidase with cupredoxin domain